LFRNNPLTKVTKSRIYYFIWH